MKDQRPVARTYLLELDLDTEREDIKLGAVKVAIKAA